MQLIEERELLARLGITRLADPVEGEGTTIVGRVVRHSDRQPTRLPIAVKETDVLRIAFERELAEELDGQHFLVWTVESSGEATRKCGSPGGVLDVAGPQAAAGSKHCFCEEGFEFAL